MFGHGGAGKLGVLYLCRLAELWLWRWWPWWWRRRWVCEIRQVFVFVICEEAGRGV